MTVVFFEMTCPGFEKTVSQNEMTDADFEMTALIFETTFSSRRSFAQKLERNLTPRRKDAKKILI
jgi:hypothetical protein